MSKHALLKHVDEDQLRNYLQDVDGRTFWKPSRFTDMGFPEYFVEGVTRDHITDPDNPMSRIFDLNKAESDPDGLLDSMIDPDSEKYTKEHLVAVHDLDLLGGLTRALGISCDYFHGRGTQAREYATRILNYLDGKA